MAYTKIQIEGLKELEAALSDLSRATARGVLARALRKAAAPIADRERSGAPYDPDRKAGTHLRDSIVVTAKTRNLTGLKEYGQTLRAGGTREEAVAALRDVRRSGASEGSRATISIGPTAPHAHLIERGTVKMAAQPFVRPAWEAEKYPALETIKTELRNEIDKSVARAARKAARIAAKG